jgi:bacterioferritin
LDRTKSITLLNKAIADELQAVHQYLYFHFHLDDQGFTPLAELFKRTAIQEMGHIEKLADRILFLKGEIEMVASGPVKKITDAEAMLTEAIHGEQQSVQDYNRSALQCSEIADAATRRIFEDLVADEERHADAFEKQSDNIRRFGTSYLALQSFERVAAPSKE